MRLDSTKLLPVREYSSLIAGLLIGLTFLASGTGKLLGELETSSQVMNFIYAVLPEFLLSPWLLHFIVKIVVPYIFPIAELLLGILLLLGFVPRLSALLCIPLSAIFAATNVWAIIAGSYATCAGCFGIWEMIFGHLTPLQSLIIDIVLMLLALIVIFMQPGRFLASRWPAIQLIDFVTLRLSAGRPLTCPVKSRVNSLWSTTLWKLSRLYRNNLWASLGYLIGIAGIVLAVLTVTGTINFKEAKNSGQTNGFAVTDNVTVVDIGSSNARITFTTANPEIVDILVYDRNGAIAGTWSENTTRTVHSIVIDNLNEATTYYFQILFSDRKGGKGISPQYSFTTLEKPPVIINPAIKDMTGDAVTIVWETDRPTTAEVDYWLEGENKFQSITGIEASTNHAVSLTGLAENGIYKFRIKSIDPYGHRLMAEYTGSFSLAAGTAVTQRAPSFQLKTINGEPFNSNQLRGKITLLAFWNISCPTCQMKMPMVQEVYDKIPTDKVAIVTIHGAGRETAIKNYVTAENFRFPVLYDAENKVGAAYNVLFVPTYYLLDKSGIVLNNNLQFNSAAELEKILNAYLK
jgi:peroxiredoxin/uncharacterized membrane protein YphA (DoxX/SURF4 family)